MHILPWNQCFELKQCILKKLNFFNIWAFYGNFQDFSCCGGYDFLCRKFSARSGSSSSIEPFIFERKAKLISLWLTIRRFETKRLNHWIQYPDGDPVMELWLTRDRFIRFWTWSYAYSTGSTSYSRIFFYILRLEFFAFGKFFKISPPMTSCISYTKIRTILPIVDIEYQSIRTLIIIMITDTRFRFWNFGKKTLTG